MTPFKEILKREAEQRANQMYFNLINRNKWLPAIRMKDSRTSEKPKPQSLRKLTRQMEAGKEN